MIFNCWNIDLNMDIEKNDLDHRIWIGFFVNLEVQIGII